MKATSGDVTVVVLAMDEEQRITPTLNSARECGLGVLIVDGGSMDATVAIAEEAGCAVVTHPFNSFAEQRNWALDHCPTPYALFVDADELLHPALAAEVRLAARTGVDGAWVPTLDYFAGRWMMHGAWYPQPHLRLVRSGAARFDGAVHERVVFTIPHPRVERLDQPLLHRSHLSVSHYLRKLDRYTEIEATAVEGRPWRLIIRGFSEAGSVILHRIVFRAGWRDGVHGLVGAVLYATYRFTIYAKAATRVPVDGDQPDVALERLARQRRRRRQRA